MWYGSDSEPETGTARMLRVHLVSGEEVLTESTNSLGCPSSRSVRELKSRLAKVSEGLKSCFADTVRRSGEKSGCPREVAGCGPRFRQRLLCGSRELCDDEELSGPAELQLVVLPPRPAGDLPSTPLLGPGAISYQLGVLRICRRLLRGTHYRRYIIASSSVSSPSYSSACAARSRTCRCQ